MSATSPVPPRGEFAPDMREITGRGGGYEAACRVMLKAGVTWLDAHPNADPRLGVSRRDGTYFGGNDDGRALRAAILEPREARGATPLMIEGVLVHCLFIRAQGWETWVGMMRAGALDEADRFAAADRGPSSPAEAEPLTAVPPAEGVRSVPAAPANPDREPSP